MRLLKRVYNQFKLTEENQIAYLWLKKTDYAKSGATREDTEGLIDHIRAIEPVLVACLFEEIEPGETRISLRSKDPAVNVDTIARQFQRGRGGFRAPVEGKPLTIQRRVISAIRRGPPGIAPPLEEAARYDAQVYRPGRGSFVDKPSGPPLTMW